jgi:AcrR family transcriptional regulator
MENASALLQQAYKDLSVAEGRFPLSFKAVAEKAGLEADSFQQHYSGLGALAEDIWATYLRETLEAVEGSPEFASYSVREKLLGIYFTLFEVLASERTFVCLYAPKLGIWNYSPDFMARFKPLWLKLIAELITEGTSSGEIAERMVMAGEYGGWHWPQLMYLLNQWVTDESEGYQRTDKAVEKSVNLGFDIMGRNVLDSAFDFLKFVVAGN